jgi:hypothetical protein
MVSQSERRDGHEEKTREHILAAEQVRRQRARLTLRVAHARSASS